MLSRLNGQRGETRVRQKEAGPRSHQKTGRNKWSWGRRGELREGDGDFPGCGGLEPTRARAQELGASGKQ